MRTVIYTGTRSPSDHPVDLDIRHWPLLETQLLQVDRSELLDWITPPAAAVLYSKNAVRSVERWSWRHALISRIEQWWAVGPKTARLAEQKLAIDCRLPQDVSFDGLVDALTDADLPSQLLSLSVAGKVRNLRRAIGERDIEWRDISVYETNAVTWHDERRRFALAEADWIALTSSRGVDALFDQFEPEELDHLHWATIGPSTGETLRRYDIDPDAIPTSPGIDNLIRTIADADRG